jgi:hypothetical protein
VVKNSWWLFGINVIIFGCQSEGEAGNAGEQPASNKIDAITIEKGVGLAAPFFISIG